MLHSISQAQVGASRPQQFGVSVPTVNGADDGPRETVPMAVPVELLAQDEKTGQIGLKPGTELSSPQILTLTPAELQSYVGSIQSACMPFGTQAGHEESPPAKKLLAASNAAGTAISVGSAIAIAAHVLAASFAAPLAMASAVGELTSAKDSGVEALHLHKFIHQTEEALKSLTPEQKAQLDELQKHEHKLLLQAGLKGTQGALLLAIVPAVCGLLGPAGVAAVPILAAASILLRAGQAVWHKVKGSPSDKTPVLRGLESEAPPLTDKPLTDADAFKDVNGQYAADRNAKLEAAGVSQPWPRLIRPDKASGDVAVVPVAVPSSMLVKNPTTGKMELPEGTTISDPNVATASAEEFQGMDRQWRDQSLPEDAVLSPKGSRGAQLIDAMWLPGLSLTAGLESRSLVRAELERAIGDTHKLALGAAAPFMAVMAALSVVGARDMALNGVNQKYYLDRQEQQLKAHGEDPHALDAPRAMEHSLFVSAAGMGGRGLMLAGATAALAAGGVAAAPLAVGLVLGAGMVGVGSMVYSQREMLKTLLPNLKDAAPILARLIAKLPSAAARGLWHKIQHLLSKDDVQAEPVQPEPAILDPLHLLQQS